MATEKYELSKEQLEKISGGMYSEYYPESAYCPASEDGTHAWEVTQPSLQDFTCLMRCKNCGATCPGTLHFGWV